MGFASTRRVSHDKATERASLSLTGLSRSCPCIVGRSAGDALVLEAHLRPRGTNGGCTEGCCQAGQPLLTTGPGQ
jgi:hypothetical protein